MGLCVGVSMARITFKGQSEYFEKLQQLEQAFAKNETLEKAVAAGAKPVADQIRQNLEQIPARPFRKLQPGELIQGLSESEQKDLEASFGLSPISRDKNGFVHTKAGFDGYGSFPTKTYPQGVPNALVARAAESGSSVRQKVPFVRPAVNATRKEAVEAMENVIDGELKKIF